jgi:hypothetical protein
MTIITLRCTYTEGDELCRKTGWVEALIHAKRVPKHYAAMWWLPEVRGSVFWGSVGHWGRKNTTEPLQRWARCIQYADVWDAKASAAWRSLFKSHFVPQGFDHTVVWRDGAKRPFVTTEPYNLGQWEQIRVWSARMGWRCVKVDGYGIWNPPCAVLHILSPPGGADVDALRDAVLRHGPFTQVDIQAQGARWTLKHTCLPREVLANLYQAGSLHGEA